MLTARLWTRLKMHYHISITKKIWRFLSDSKSVYSSFKLNSLRKHPFLLALRRWGRFAAEERLRLSGRNSVLMTQINVYIINPVVMGFQILIYPVLCVFWSVLVKCCVHLPTSSSKTQIHLLEKTILHKY